MTVADLLGVAVVVVVSLGALFFLVVLGLSVLLSTGKGPVRPTRRGR